MDKVWIIMAPGGHILTVTTSEEKALEIIDLENEARPGAYRIVPSGVVPQDHYWIARSY